MSYYLIRGLAILLILTGAEKYGFAQNSACSIKENEIGLYDSTKGAGWQPGYLNSRFKRTNNPKKAAYQRFIFYHEGKELDAGIDMLYPLQKRTIVLHGDTLKGGGLKVLNGTYKIYRGKKMIPVQEITFVNGVVTQEKVYTLEGDGINRSFIYCWNCDLGPFIKDFTYQANGDYTLNLWLLSGKGLTIYKPLPFAPESCK